jgi:hypothetical protein
VKVAVVPEAVIVPATAVAPGPAKVKVVALIVEASIETLNVAVMIALRATPVEVSAGTVDTTVGAAGGGGGGGGLDPPPPQAALKELKSAKRRKEKRFITTFIEDLPVALLAPRPSIAAVKLLPTSSFSPMLHRFLEGLVMACWGDQTS